MTASTAGRADVASARPSARESRRFRRHDLLATGEMPGPREHASVGEILALMQTLPVWPTASHQEALRYAILRGTRAVLEWLQTHPGTGWQERWRWSGADQGMHWVDALAAVPGQVYDRQHNRVRNELVHGLCFLMLCRVLVVPSYDFLAAYRAHNLFKYARRVFRPDLFATWRPPQTAWASTGDAAWRPSPRSARSCCAPGETSTG